MLSIKAFTITALSFRKYFIKIEIYLLHYMKLVQYIRAEFRKIRTRKTSVFGHFSRSVSVTLCNTNLLQSMLMYFVSINLSRKLFGY